MEDTKIKDTEKEKLTITDSNHPKVFLRKLTGLTDTQIADIKTKSKETKDKGDDLMESTIEPESDKGAIPKSVKTKYPKVFLRKITYPFNEQVADIENQTSESSNDKETSSGAITQNKNKKKTTPKIASAKLIRSKTAKNKYMKAKMKHHSGKESEVEDPETWNRKLPETTSKAFKLMLIMTLFSRISSVESRSSSVNLIDLPGSTGLGKAILMSAAKNQLENSYRNAREQFKFKS